MVTESYDYRTETRITKHAQARVYKGLLLGLVGLWLGSSFRDRPKIRDPYHTPVPVPMFLVKRVI